MDVTDVDLRDTDLTGPQQQLSNVQGNVGRQNAHAGAVSGGRMITDAVYRLKQRRNPSPAERTNTNVGGDAGSKDRRTSDGRLPLQETSRYQAHARASSLQEESPEDMVLRLSNEFDPIVERGWDTVIYVGPPPQEHRQDDHEYEYIRQHFSKPYLFNSQSLKDAGSSQFSRFLGPMSARSERKLKKIGVHNQIPQDRKPKYYIDLRPMQDEDEALLMITELTCTPGVLSWHMSHMASGVPKTLINGRDDLNVTMKPYARSWIEVDDVAADDDEDAKLAGQSKKVEGTDEAILGLEPEYSAIRHYMAIERLLHALAGRDPKLNSAAKVWTYFSIAKFFDCATNPKVNTWIFNWLFTGNNANFVQANPEIAYRLAMGMRSPDILRTSFSMLVGERALMQAGRKPSDSMVIRPGASRVSIHGRITCHLDDDEINRIDHAALSLTKRMTTIFLSLADDSLQPTSKDSELAKFLYLQDWYNEKAIVEGPLRLVQEYVRGELFQALSQDVEEGDWMRLYRSKGFREFNWLKRSRAFADAYNAMSLTQRILTQSFWSQLENYGLYQELEKTIAWTRGHSLEGLDELAPDYGGEISCVPKSILINEIEGMNEEIYKNKLWTQLNKRTWSIMSYEVKDEDDMDFKDFGIEPDAINASVDPDKELVRAMQGLGKFTESGLTGLQKPYHDGHFDTSYPYTAVAKQHRQQSPTLAVRPAVLLSQMTMDMRYRIMREVLTPGYMNTEMGIESEISISQMDILLCLNDDEWKYLPLWAGGLDDGSGGVFAELDVPDMLAVEGFRGGKIGLGNIPGAEGSVGGSFSMAGDSEDFDEVMTDEGISTVGKASRIATDGTTSAGGSTVMSLDE